MRKASRQARRTRIEQALQRIREVLPAKAAGLGIRRAVLFGSAGRGEIDGRGDIDLLIVQETDLPFVRRGADVVRALDLRAALDVVVYTPEEWVELRAANRFVRRAVREGQVIHATDA